MNVANAPDFFAEERIKVSTEEARKIALNQAYDKFQSHHEKSQTRQLLELAQEKFHSRINQWKIIMIISTYIQNTPAKVWTDYFVAVNLNPHH